MFRNNRYSATQVNQITLHYLQSEFNSGKAEGSYNTTFMDDGTTINEYRGKQYIKSAASLSLAKNKPMFRLFRKGSTEGVGVFSVVSDNQEDTDLEFLGDVLKTLKARLEDPENSAVVNYLVIPIAERNYFFNRPFRFWQRSHFVTLFVDLRPEGNKAILFDSKGSLSGYYDISNIRAALHEVYPTIQFSAVYKNHQAFLNESDCGAWCVAYSVELALTGSVSDNVQIDRQQQQRFFETHLDSTGDEEQPPSSSGVQQTPGSPDEVTPDGIEQVVQQKAKKPNFVARHKAAIMVGIIAASVLLAAVAIGVLVYFTAPVSLPIIAMLTAKVGIPFTLAAMQSLPTLAMAAITGGAAAVLLGTAAAVIGGITVGLKTLFSRKKPPAVELLQEVKTHNPNDKPVSRNSSYRDLSPALGVSGVEHALNTEPAAPDGPSNVPAESNVDTKIVPTNQKEDELFDGFLVMKRKAWR